MQDQVLLCLQVTLPRNRTMPLYALATPRLNADRLQKLGCLNTLEKGDTPMNKILRSMLVKVGYSLISVGFKLPNSLLLLKDDFFERIYLRDFLKQLRIGLTQEPS